ncbi:unnamed protein product [Rhizophagus irregularis]|nr:unnamed protein product [Rhizophagus irregularis]
MSNKSKSFKTDYGSRLITSKFYNFEHLSSLKPKNATEEEQRAFHSKHYAFNLSDSNNSSALKIEKYFKDLSTNLINKFKSLKINSKKDDNRNENELLQQETNNNINTNHYNMNSNSINLSETKNISAYSSSECSSRAFSFNISDISEDNNTINVFIKTDEPSLRLNRSTIITQYNNPCSHKRWKVILYSEICIRNNLKPIQLECILIWDISSQSPFINYENN